MDEFDRQARRELVSSIGHLLDLSWEDECDLLKRFKAIESNRELINSLPEILEGYF